MATNMYCMQCYGVSVIICASLKIKQIVTQHLRSYLLIMYKSTREVFYITAVVLVFERVFYHTRLFYRVRQNKVCALERPL